MRGIAALSVTVALAASAGLFGAASPAAAQTSDCAQAQVPPPPPAVEEIGRPTPPPLPWPSNPVGGPALGSCGDLGPPGVPAVPAASYVLADLDSGTILAARAPHARQRPASTLKILTALTVRQRLSPDQVLDGQPEDLSVDGSKAGIGPGGHYTVRQLMHGMLLNSGNDTAQALARGMGGDAATTADMTGVARQLGALDTRPATPSGLDGPGMTCSAYDLALLFRVAMRDPLFAQIIATEATPFPGYGDKPGFTLTTDNKLVLNYPGAIGGKSGFTDAARHTLVGAAQRNGRRLVVAVMRSEPRPQLVWRQAAQLLDWGFAQPRDAPGVGVLVDRNPVPGVTMSLTSPPNGQTAATDTATDAAGEVRDSDLPVELLVVGSLIALAAGLIRWRTRS